MAYFVSGPKVYDPARAYAHTTIRHFRISETGGLMVFNLGMRLCHTMQVRTQMARALGSHTLVNARTQTLE